MTFKRVRNLIVNYILTRQRKRRAERIGWGEGWPESIIHREKDAFPVWLMQWRVNLTERYH